MYIYIYISEREREREREINLMKVENMEMPNKTIVTVFLEFLLFTPG